MYIWEKYFFFVNLAFPTNRLVGSKSKVEVAALEKFPCHKCGKRFWQNSTLTDHIDFHHMGLKKYQCQKCNTAFETKPRLKKHFDSTGKCTKAKMRKKKKGKGNLQCLRCQESFLNHRELTKHVISVVCLRLPNQVWTTEKIYTSAKYVRAENLRLRKFQEFKLSNYTHSQ